MPFPTLDPDNVKAVITTLWSDGRGYAPTTIQSVEGYTIETNLDEDSDPFNIIIGDRFGDFAEMLHRDNEVRVQIFGIGENISYLLTGIADTVVYTDDGYYVINGRDRSCIATDTIAEPVTYRHVRASDVIAKMASEMKVATKLDLTPTNILGKVATDGSETAWEFWYRYIRRAGQWMWLEPDGTLKSSKLNYELDPVYYFGQPIKGSSVGAGKWIPVEHGEYHSSKQGRLWQPILYYHNGGRVVPLASIKDRTIKNWLRQPVKLFERKDIVHPKAAVHFVEEEIFESKVGSLEIKLVIPDPGIVIRQNNIAQVNVPELQMGGTWFVVGTRIIADNAGFTQEVRLREVGFAISKRVPTDPVQSQEPGKDATKGGELSKNISLPKHQEWMQCFVDGAEKWHGGHEFQWFLACLLAICEQETGFTNERNVSTNPPGVHGVEWFDWDKTVKGPQHGIKDYAEWELSFSNEKSGVVGTDLAVGPMQLLSQGYKDWADEIGGTKGELRGGRWDACANIVAGARALHEKAVSFHVDGPPNDSIFTALAAYGEGTGYAKSVMAKALEWYEIIKEAYTTTQEEVDSNDAVEAVQGTVKEIAEAILDFHKQGKYRSDNGDSEPQDLWQIQQMAKGQRVPTPSCPKLGNIQIGPKPLGAIKMLLDRGYLVGTFALATNHTHLGCGSRHSIGQAVDISSIGIAGKDGTGFMAINHGGAACKRVTMQAMSELRAQKVGVLKPNQLICNGVGGSFDSQVQSLQLNDFKDDSYVDGDHTDHFHVGY